jgi:hypothetical protein
MPPLEDVTRVPSLANYNTVPFQKPIARTEAQSRVQKSYDIVAGPESSVNTQGSDPSHLPNFEANGRREEAVNTASGPMSPQYQVALEIETPQTSQVADINRRMTHAPHSNALSQHSNADSIPEVATRHRLAPRGAAGSSGEPGGTFRRPRRRTERTENEERARQFKRFLIRRFTQGSAPGGSAAS